MYLICFTHDTSGIFIMLTKITTKQNSGFRPKLKSTFQIELRDLVSHYLK